jgi:hypothetical protein
MADEDKVLDFLRERFNRLDARLDGIAHDVHELKVTQAAILQILTSHDARMLRVEERLDRIERRLELTSTPAAG